MTLYEINITIETQGWFRIEADTPEQAEDEARKLGPFWADKDDGGSTMQIQSVVEIAAVA